MHRFSAAEPAAPPGAMVPVAHRVAAKRRDTHDTWTLTLEPENGGLPAFGPGQFAMLYRFGVGEVPISISAKPAAPGSLVHTIRAVGPVSESLCRLEPGDAVGVRGPFGTTWPLEERVDCDVVIVAGGIGLAPLRPAIHHVLANRARYRRLVVLYGARAPAERLYQDELEQWAGEPDTDVAVTLDAAGPEWHGRVGLVTTLITPMEVDTDNVVALVVGPEVMMRFTVEALRERGIAAEDIYISMERNMQCGVGHCGHCQLGPLFICKDGPVFRHDRIEPWLKIREL